MEIAVITGASSGMGREFVKGVAKDEKLDEIWVIARRAEKLAALQDEVDTKLRIVPLDLVKPESFETYQALLEQEKPNVETLVNASGSGRFKLTMETPLKVLLDMIDLNDKALVSMIYRTVPYMQPGSRIINLDSLSSFQPVPYINTYGATKAFVLSFSRALNVELRPKGIRVMAVCPGWVKTEFFDHAIDDDSVTYFNILYEAEDIIKTALKDDKKRKDVSIHGFPVRMQVLFTKLLPHKLIMKIWMKQQKHA